MNVALKVDSFGEQIAKLLPMLSGNHDGEVLAAARAIDRKLKANGKDWHWLAAKVAVRDYKWDFSAASEPTPSRPEAPPRPPPKPRPPRPTWSKLSRFQQIRWLEVLAPLPFVAKADRLLIADVKKMLHLGQSFYLPPQHARRLSNLIRLAAECGHGVDAS